MFETLGFETLTAPQAAVIFAVVLGLAFGVLAEATRFCFRRSLVGEDRKQALGIWLTALITALIGTQAAVAAGWINFGDHRFMVADMPVMAIVLGGLLFGAGMLLTRGCVSRLSVLSASGNLRAVFVLIIFAIVAHATLKGVLAPVRTSLGSVTFDLGITSLAELPGGALAWSLAIALGATAYVLRSGNRPLALAAAAVLGLLVPLGWVGTGLVLYDDFDPIAMESLSFTAPWADSLFFVVASTAIPAGFGTGLVAGVLAGAFASAALFGRFEWVSLSSPRETGRYALGAALMGVGGVLAGGCTVGAGLAGVPSLSVAALLALGAIAVGAITLNRVLGTKSQPHGLGTALHPAE